MQDHVRKIIDLLLANNRKVHNSRVKAEIEKHFGCPIGEGPGEIRWRKMTGEIKYEAIDAGMVVIPVDAYWELNPASIGVQKWMQRITGGWLTESLLINEVLRLGIYRQQEELSQFAEQFRKTAEIHNEIYQKLRSETGIDTDTDTEEP